MTVSHLIPEEVQKSAMYVDTNTHIDNYIIAANTAQSLTKPTNGNYVVFAADGDFWVAYDRTASTSSTNITDGTGSEFKPVVRDVRHVTTISVNATAARKLSCLWYK